MTGLEGDLKVARWKKYGKDQSYVGHEGVAALGLAVPEETAPADPPYAMVVDRLARDLGGNVAGAGAREMAQQLKAQAPVRSFLARALGVHTDERAWRVGAEGERLIGGQLAKLEKLGWTVGRVWARTSGAPGTP